MPAAVDQLPDLLRDECLHLAVVYAPPGALLLAYAGDVPVGCVGLRPATLPVAVEVKRLYVRPSYQGNGVARLLMEYAHRHAVDAGFSRLVLDVMSSRTRVIDFYRRLGYVDAEPTPDAVRYSMVSLTRRCWLRAL
ncbi:GNAT family N-acetyltransferase [Luedemannella flava]